jgi:hypothetical protein
MFGNRSKRTQRRLEEHGRRATATVIDRAEKGMAITHGSSALVGNTEFALKLTLRIEPAGEPSFDVETKLRFPQMSVPQAGSRIAVIYDPDDHDDIMLDDAPSSYTPNLRPDQEESIRVAQEMALAGRSPQEISGAIDAVRAKAGIAPAQTMGAAPDPVEQLARLGELHSTGVLDDAEFQAMKARILSGEA